MAFVNRLSCEGVKSELDLFSLLTIQTSIEDGQLVEQREGPSSFSHPDLGMITKTWPTLTCTYGRASSKGRDEPQYGKRRGSCEQLVAFAVQSMTLSANPYTCRAYTETLLSYGTNTLWYKDTAGHMDVTDKANEGMWQRREHINENRW